MRLVPAKYGDRHRHHRQNPFFIRPYHVKEDKKILDKEVKRLCYLGILKDGFLAY